MENEEWRMNNEEWSEKRSGGQLLRRKRGVREVASGVKGEGVEVR